MKTVYILNAFSLNMLDREDQRGTPNGYVPRSSDANSTARVPRPCADPVDQIAEFAQYPQHYQIKSAVGHESTAAVFASVLGMDIPYNRETVKLKDGDFAIIGQYIGPRLEEGATELPEGAAIQWWII